ncbi:phage holin family protein [Sphingomonas japonica]|uniref:Holin-X, holin superfamily III n=1 Tax=Sphingomonas japonica TaxID=511662 RepID=A0ABX0U6K8_9SPHN|nr:phage holin family protein [Sphingomonas japonica]NIJ24882.1 hypothetical protein [Sphingomonas japonica]
MQAPGPDADEGVATLVTRLVAEAKDYGRAEMAYVQAIARERTGDAAHGVGLLAAATFLGLATLTTMLVGLVLMLTPAIGAAGATTVVVFGAGLITALLGKIGIDRMRHAARKSDPGPPS